MMRSGLVFAHRNLVAQSSWVALFAVWFLVVLGCVAERVQQPVGALDRALVSSVFGLALPVVAWFVVRSLSARTSMARALFPLARCGSNRKLAFLGVLCGGGLWTTVFALILSFTAMLITSLSLQAGGLQYWLVEVGTTGWVAVLGAAAYVALFGLGSCLGTNGQGSIWLLILDWVLGRGSGFLAMVWPRAHLRNLLGGEATLNMSQTAAAAVLIALSLIWLITAHRRMPA